MMATSLVTCTVFFQEIKSKLDLLLFSSLIFIKLKPMSHKNPKNKHVLVALRLIVLDLYSVSLLSI